jgi:hypothetical protein
MNSNRAPNHSYAATASRLRLPPYGRELMQMREAGLVPADGMCVVSLDSWQYGKGRSRVVITADLDPEQINFAFVAGIDATIIHDPCITSTDRRNACIRALLRFNPTRLLVCTLGDVTRLQWIKSKAVGVELAEFA